MEKAFSSLDSGMRVTIALALFALSSLAGLMMLRTMVNGPWFAALGVALVCCGAVTVGFEAWPGKLPAALSDMMDRWEKARKKATKTGGGRFVWSCGRTALAAIAAKQALPLMTDIEGLIAWALIGGFATSVGFFGIRSALWAGIITIALGHRAALSGLEYDFADPAARALFVQHWNSGFEMSWWWPIGLAAGPFLWVGMSASMVAAGENLQMALKDREAAADAQRRIDARRERLRARREAEAKDPVAVAALATQQAMAQVAAASTGAHGNLSPADLRGPEAPKPVEELSGVAKLEHDRNDELLKRYASHAVQIFEFETSGIDTNTLHRRSFDRVIMALTPDQLAQLRAASWSGAADLLSYHAYVCSGENAALFGSDGEVVTMTPAYSSDEIPAAPEPLSTRLDPTVVGADTLEVDLLDQEANLLPEAADLAPRPKREIDLEPMLSEAAKAVADEANSEDAGAETMGDDLLDAVRARSPGDVDIASAEHLVMPDEPEGEYRATARGTDAERIEEDGRPAGEGNREGDETAARTEAAEQNLPLNVAVDDQRKDGPEALPATVTIAAPAIAVVHRGAVPLEQRRDAAVRIAIGVLDRPFITETNGWFGSMPELLEDLPDWISEAIVAPKFEMYGSLLEAADLERRLVGALESEGLDEARVLSEKLKIGVAGWEADAALVSRAAGWIAQKEEEARLLALEEARRQQEILDEEARVRREAEAEKQRQDEAAEADRVRQEQEQRRLDDERRQEEEAAAEKERVEALAAQRWRYATRILAGILDDDVLVEGGELFPTVESLVEVLEIDAEHLLPRFQAFGTRRDAKQKFDELQLAMHEQQLEQVRELLRDEASFAAYEHPTFSLAVARDWLKGQEATSLIAGLVEEHRDIPALGNRGDLARKMMQRRNRITPEQVELIEQRLPQAVIKARKLGDAVAILGDENPSLLENHADALRAAGALASILVSEESQCREYANTFFPADARNPGVEVWELVCELAAHAPAAGGAKPHEAPLIPAAPPAAGRQLLMISEPLTLERVQQMDIMEEIGKIEFGGLKEGREYEEQFLITIRGEFQDDPKTHPAGLGGLMVDLAPEHGGGRILFSCRLARIPLWYDAERDLVHAVATDDGFRLITIPGDQVVDNYRGILRNTQNQVRGVVIASPFASEAGLISFQPMLEKIQEGPVVILNNGRLNEQDFSAFLQRVQKA
ncbi:hypothetical protein [Sphingosinicella sp. BN140058]|uniref:hypothetical protein n=1 Tax=Sphingosinicella sp. BN140058 TaxID=1892855 RepID=UPI001011DF28|nr:hypothetical protein [Sphingosinicella sp. BN140058]QAY80119.1 hypothetical protein ETR14_26110 [Sphingosinicella sp. BN140058]